MKSFKSYVENRDLNEMARFNVDTHTSAIDTAESEALVNRMIEAITSIHNLLGNDKIDPADELGVLALLPGDPKFKDTQLNIIEPLKNISLAFTTKFLSLDHKQKMDLLEGFSHIIENCYRRPYIYLNDDKMEFGAPNKRVMNLHVASRFGNKEYLKAVQTHIQMPLEKIEEVIKGQLKRMQIPENPNA